ncbi:YbaL family putative K(+) efflux transporter [Demequina zhanjiangensis]|uniref:YbaL family putative K(+) efflux transporter n=1 Tax=Demequina zhanjiangensis TaxID=3051659 RepID=A0ABT8G2R4_9MICO|nr:YbaL family putative K(+) efflux transporter [Demequina sp. SYSU T00b26]MDN4473428.1 YbaL family putative K(+) efflux transporter [Demequina sp. SYSU T00b26]
MLHHAPLLLTIAAGLVAAFMLGFVAQKAKLSPIVGYLAAGLLIGPYTPGFVGDAEIATQLSEIGVILLMFGVGLHFSLKDLLSVKKVAIPGAVVQMTLATVLGTLLGHWLGWGWGPSLLFGLALSVASTVVMLRALEDRGLLDTRAGHIAIGWLIVEDLAMVAALVIIPVVGQGAASPAELAGEVGLAAVKVAAFVAVMVLFGRRAIPWILARTADTGSRELFTLGVLALSLGVAVGAAALFDVSFALGAFFAGTILKESDLAHRAAEDSQPLRDTFAVLFFVSVGMLVDPAIVVERPYALIATVLAIVVGKSIGAYALVRLLKYSKSMSLVIAASLAQIGEFSFILVTLGGQYDILPDDAQDLVLAGAILSIVINPALFAWASRSYVAKVTDDATSGETGPIAYVGEGHAIVVTYGRVGRRMAAGLWARDMACVVISDDEDHVNEIRSEGHDAILGNAVRSKVLRAAGVEKAHTALIGIPDPIQAGAVVAKIRRLSPGTTIVARGHHQVDVDYLTEMGADRVYVGVHEIADLMVAAAVEPEEPSA